MSFLDRFRRRSSAPVARERLQILLSHERSIGGPSELLARLRDEIVAVVARHIPVERDHVLISMDRGDAVSRLEINVEIPHRAVLRSVTGPSPAAGMPVSAPGGAARG